MGGHKMVDMASLVPVARLLDGEERLRVPFDDRELALVLAGTRRASAGAPRATGSARRRGVRRRSGKPQSAVQLTTAVDLHRDVAQSLNFCCR